ncbi:MAG TPA: 16S rRNA (guanine(527)-N(7))-methyltransferase RsmG [Egibacteraceae bacterium]|nr:16S rRNA (guanine(527)-N(7))-methyltransferase RsmG [Egibacteraceae bacterium]
MTDALEHLAQLIATSPHNLVSRGERARVGTMHIPESLAVAKLLPVKEGSRWVDLGTGGGLPGLVLAVAHPSVEWTLIDATQKKVAEVARFAEELELSNVHPIAGRAEALGHDPAYRGRFDGVVSRAVAPLPVVAELSRGFVHSGGVVAVVKGPRALEEMQRSSKVLADPLRLTDLHSRVVPGTARATHLVMMRARGSVPTGYPRRDGVPRTHPLGEP